MIARSPSGLRVPLLAALLLGPFAVAAQGQGTGPCGELADCIARLAERSTHVSRPGEDAQVRELARAIAARGEAALDPLRGQLGDSRPSVRSGAARALGEMGRVARPAVPELIVALDQGIGEAAWALGAIADPRAAPALRNALLQNASPAEAHALTRLGRPGFEAIAEAFASESLSERAAQLLLEAFREGGPGIEAAVGGVTGVLAESTRPSFVRAYAAASLGAVGPPAIESAQALRELLKDASPVVQQAALDALAQVGDRTVAPILLERAGAPEWSTRLAAFTGLAHLGPAAKAVVPQLLPSLASADFEQRALAVEALGWIRDRRAIPALTTVLKGNSWSASEQATRALTLLAAREAIPALRETAQRHWRKRVRQAATVAIGEIQRGGGHPSRQHDFRDVDSARRVLVAVSEKEGCPGSPEQGWRARRGGQVLTLRPVPGGEDVPSLLPSVLPPVRLGRDDGFKERMHGHSVEEGWLVARDAGEWGGALWFVGWDGRKEKLADQPVEGFVPTPGGLLALGGLPHRSRSAGAAWKLLRSSGGSWRAEPLVELPGAPVAWESVPGGSVVVMTQSGAVDLSPDGSLRELECEGPARQ